MIPIGLQPRWWTDLIIASSRNGAGGKRTGRTQASQRHVNQRSVAGGFRACIDGWPKLTMRRTIRETRFECSTFKWPVNENPPAGRIYLQRRERSLEAGLRPAYFISGDQDHRLCGGIEKFGCEWHLGVLRRRCRGLPLLSDLLNSIYEMCERSARQNVQQGIISVDADREQSQWTADSWNIGNVLLYNHRNTMMIDQAVRDYAVEQLPNGNFPACCPANWSRCIPEWFHVLADAALATIFVFGGPDAPAHDGTEADAFPEMGQTISGSNHQTRESSRMANLRLRRRQHAQRRLQHRHGLPIL